MDIKCIFEYNSCNDDGEKDFIKYQQSKSINVLTTADVKFEPPQETETLALGQRTSYVQTKQHCITFMKEYASKSIEELRVADYAANLKGLKDKDSAALSGVQKSMSSFVFPQKSTQPGFNFTQQLPIQSHDAVFDFKTTSPSLFKSSTSSMETSEIGSASFNFRGQPQATNKPLFNFGQPETTTSVNASLNDRSSLLQPKSARKHFKSTQKPAFKTPLKFVDDKVLTCKIVDQIIPENMELNFIGQHEDGKTNMDVISIKFINCTVTKIPQALTKSFPNLKILWITNSMLKEICKADLVEYKNFEDFCFDNNEIEVLPGDLFEDFKNLKYIKFYDNKLTSIEPNILDGLDMLKLVDFRGNQNYGKIYSSCAVDFYKTTLEDIKCELFEKYPKKYDHYKDLKNSKKVLEDKVQVLIDSKIKLESELEQEKLKTTNLTKKLQTGFYHDIKNYVNDETTKDFKVIIDDQECLVHKCMLAARSPALAELLKNNPEVVNLNLVDIPMEIFVKILKYLYKDELPGEDKTNFLHLFAVAAKLKLEELKNYAAKMLMDKFCQNNIIEVFKLSNNYEHEELRQKAFDELKNFYPNYRFKDEWITKPDIVLRAIEQFMKNEEAIRKLEEEFENSSI